jgi:hypothetical protein
MNRIQSKSRREFLRDSALITAGMVTTGHGAIVRSDPDKKLNLAFIGPGGRGFSNLTALASENIVAFADVDDVLARPAFEAYPKANRYRDFRVMLDKEKSLDGVVVSTPDHTHAIAAISAMKRGLHVYWCGDADGHAGACHGGLAPCGRCHPIRGDR